MNKNQLRVWILKHIEAFPDDTDFKIDHSRGVSRDRQAESATLGTPSGAYKAFKLNGTSTI